MFTKKPPLTLIFAIVILGEKVYIYIVAIYI
jgi:hypothetical protein